MTNPILEDMKIRIRKLATKTNSIERNSREAELLKESFTIILDALLWRLELAEKHNIKLTPEERELATLINTHYNAIIDKYGKRL